MFMASLLVPTCAQRLARCQFHPLPCASASNSCFAAGSGRLQDSWALLPGLQVLDVSSNALSGSLPPAWARHFTNLTALNLSNNTEIGGSLPEGADFPVHSASENIWIESLQEHGTVQTHPANPLCVHDVMTA